MTIRGHESRSRRGAPPPDRAGQRPSSPPSRCPWKTARLPPYPLATVSAPCMLWLPTGYFSSYGGIRHGSKKRL